jgi:hypothetical protein
MAGYSGAPLAKKLGLTSPMTVVLVNAPEGYREWLAPVPPGLKLTGGPGRSGPIAAAHVFVSRRADLERLIVALRKRLEPTGFVWVSWPKQASKVATDITEDTIREIALPKGLVDVKVCAVSEVWSGLKLMIRKSARRSQQRTRSR